MCRTEYKFCSWKSFNTMKTNYNLLSNAELNIILHELENEYESVKGKIRLNLERLDVLDKKYIEIKNLLNKRTRGKI